MRTQNATRSSAAREGSGGPVRNPEFAELDLDALRSYRQALMAEEDRVSYWRRLIQSRLDILQAGSGVHVLDRGGLPPVLGSEQLSRGRVALMNLLPASQDLPPLPHLDGLWASRVDESDTAGVRALTRDLAAAERELSAYRTGLHTMLGAATDELIARYHERPLACLVALPLPAEERTE